MMRRASGLVVAALILAACSSGGSATQNGTTPSVSAQANAASGSTPPAALTIDGAASLKGALEKVKMAYEAENPGTTLSISTDGKVTHVATRGAPPSAEDCIGQRLMRLSFSTADAGPHLTARWHAG